jgi:hypothetical protein
MATTQYIGARYVPVFADPIDWDNTKAYEPLTIVVHEGNSYTSRQYVPAGIDIANTSYWALTGNYNSQLEQYRSEVKTFDDRITANTTSNTTQDAQLAGTTDSGLKTLINAEHTTNVNQDAQLAGTTELVNAEHTTNVAQDAQLAGTADSGLKTLITNESTARGNKDTALDAQLAGTADSGLKTLVKSKSKVNYIYALTKYANGSTYNFKLQRSMDCLNFATVAKLPDKVSCGINAATNGIWCNNRLYVIRDNTYWYSSDMVNFSDELTIISNPSSDSMLWAGTIAQSTNGKYYFVFAYTDDRSTDPLLFRIMSTEISFNSDGSITQVPIEDCNTMIGRSSDSSHIDPSVCVVSNSILLMVKDGISDKEKIYTVNETFTNVVDTNYTCKGFGVEAGKLVKTRDDHVIAYIDPYNFNMDENNTGTPANNTGYYPRFGEIVATVYDGSIVSNDLYELTNQEYSHHIAYFNADVDFDNIISALDYVDDATNNVNNFTDTFTVNYNVPQLKTIGTLNFTNYPFGNIKITGYVTEEFCTFCMINYVQYFKQNREIIPIYVDTEHVMVLKKASTMYSSSSHQYFITSDGIFINLYLLPESSIGFSYDFGNQLEYKASRYGNRSSYTLPIPYYAYREENCAGTVVFMNRTTMAIIQVSRNTNPTIAWQSGSALTGVSQSIDSNSVYWLTLTFSDVQYGGLTLKGI